MKHHLIILYINNIFIYSYFFNSNFIKYEAKKHPKQTRSRKKKGTQQHPLMKREQKDHIETQQTR